jgi:glutaredoxin
MRRPYGTGRTPAVPNERIHEETVTETHHTAVLYTREGCCLCDRARAVLLRLQQEYNLQFQEVDIAGDPRLLDRYQFTIPVVLLDGELEFGPTKIAEHYLRRALDAGRERKRSWPWSR